jgi:hypothetical protein
MNQNMFNLQKFATFATFSFEQCSILNYNILSPMFLTLEMIKSRPWTPLGCYDLFWAVDYFFFHFYYSGSDAFKTVEATWQLVIA